MCLAELYDSHIKDGNFLFLVFVGGCFVAANIFGEKCRLNWFESIVSACLSKHE